MDAQTENSGGEDADSCDVLTNTTSGIENDPVIIALGDVFDHLSE